MCSVNWSHLTRSEHSVLAAWYWQIECWARYIILCSGCPQYFLTLVTGTPRLSMNHSPDSHYADQRRSLSSTTQYPAQYNQYQSVQHVAQPHYAAPGYPSPAFQSSPHVQPSAYAAQQNMAQMPATYAIQPSESYPGGTGTFLASASAQIY